MKLFTPLNIGGLELSHRVAFECAAHPPALEMLPRGTLMIVAEVDPAVAWQHLVEAQHAAGRVVVGRLKQSAFTVDRLGDAAKRMRDAGFDAIEYDGTDAVLVNLHGMRAEGDDSPLLDAIDQLLGVWDAARLGVRLAPFAAGEEDIGTARAFAGTLELLCDHEIAYVHLAGMRGASGRVSAITSEAAARLRQAFPNVMVASGDFDLDAAAAAVESRWADVVCLPLESGADDALIIDRIRRSLDQTR